jgi:hypothetical protein
LTSGLGLLKLALADVLALLELVLALEGVVELFADVTDVSNGLKVENTLDILKRGSLDPSFC